MTRSTNNPAYVAFLAQLRAERKAQGVSQVQVAETLGNRQTFVSKVETGERRLDVVELLGYLDAIGVDPAGFMERLRTRLRGILRKDRKLAVREAAARRRR